MTFVVNITNIKDHKQATRRGGVAAALVANSKLQLSKIKSSINDRKLQLSNRRLKIKVKRLSLKRAKAFINNDSSESTTSNPSKYTTHRFIYQALNISYQRSS